MENNTFNILFSVNHMKSPFTDTYVNKSGKTQTNKLTRGQKIWAVVATIFVGLATLGIGAAPTFFALTAYFKAKNRQNAPDPKQPPEPPPASVRPPGSPPLSPFPALPGGFAVATPIAHQRIQTALVSRVNSVKPWVQALPKPAFPLPPIDGIKVGLPNKGNTCWLNSAIKYMATSADYDDLLLMHPSKLEGKKELIALQKALKEVVFELRTGDDGYVSEQALKSLISAVKGFWPTKPIANDKGNTQHDATEFLRDVRARFHYPTDLQLSPNLAAKNPKISNSCYQAIGHYSSQGSSVVKFANVQNYNPVLTIDIPPLEANLDTPLNIRDEFIRPDLREVKPDFALAEGVNIDRNRKFEYHQQMIHAPETLEVFIKRKVLNQYGTEEKCERKVDLDAQGRMVIIEHAPTVSLTKDQATFTLPKAEVIYEAQSCILHDQFGDGGHYTSIEKSADGKYHMHNDSVVSELTQKQAVKYFKKATMIRFRAVERINVSPSC